MGPRWATALLGLDAPCDYGCDYGLVSAGAQGTWAAAGQLRPSPVGITARAAGGPQAKRYKGWDADAVREQSWIHVNF